MENKHTLSRKLKIMLTTLPVMLLAGCGTAGAYVSDWKLPIESFSQRQYDIGLKWAYIFNCFGGITMNAIDGFAGTEYIEQSKEAFASFSNYIQIFQWIAIGFIAVKFGQAIFNTYFRENQKFAMPVTSLLKKLVVAFILTWALPYMVFTAYYGASSLGLAVSSAITTQSSDNGDNAPYFKLYKEMWDLHIGGQTYCSYSVSDNPNPEISKMPEDKLDLIIVEPGDADNTTGSDEIDKRIKQIAGDDDAKYKELIGEYKDVWDHSCGFFANGADAANNNVYRVGEAIAVQPNMRSTLIFGSGAGAIGSILNVLTGITVIAFNVFVGVAFIRRLLDCMLMVATGWYAIGNSMTDERNESMQGFLKKLASMALTQMTLIVELAIFEAMQFGNTGGGWFRLVANLAWILMLMGTPTAIAEMTNTTGALSGGLKVGSHLLNRVRGG